MEAETGRLCIPNISKVEQQKRLMVGMLMLIISLAILVALVAAGISLWWRLVLFPFFAVAASGFFQWRDKT